MDNQRRNRGGQWGRNDDNAPRKPEPRRDAGAYIGRMPERSPEPVPGGMIRRDDRAAGVATQPAPVRGDTRAPAGVTPAGPEGGAAPEGGTAAPAGGTATDPTKVEAPQNS